MKPGLCSLVTAIVSESPDILRRSGLACRSFAGGRCVTLPTGHAQAISRDVSEIRFLNRLPRPARVNAWLLVRIAAFLRRNESGTKCRVQRVMRMKLGPSGLSFGCHWPGMSSLSHRAARSGGTGPVTSQVSESTSMVTGTAPSEWAPFGSLHPILGGLARSTRAAHWRYLEACPSAVQLVDPADWVAHHRLAASLIQGGALS